MLNFIERVKSHKIKTRMLIINYESRLTLEAAYLELTPLLAEGKIIHYQLSLAQAQGQDILIIVEASWGFHGKGSALYTLD